MPDFNAENIFGHFTFYAVQAVDSLLIRSREPATFLRGMTHCCTEQ